MAKVDIFILGSDTIPKIAKLSDTSEESWWYLLNYDREFSLTSRVIVVNGGTDEQPS